MTRTVADPQSYLKIIYLLLAFPLGILYFVFLVAGLSPGLGLSITLAGIPLLLSVLAGSLMLCKFERILAVRLLKLDVPISPKPAAARALWPRAKALLFDKLTWTGILCLLFKFPIGVATFTITVVLLAVSIGLVFAPAYLWTSDALVWGQWVLDPHPAAWIPTAIGIPLVVVSFYLLNIAAEGLGSMTRAMLGRTGARSRWGRGSSTVVIQT